MRVNAFITLFSAIPITFFVALGMYVMYSVGLYRMSSYTGLKPAFLAWIPVLRLYLLGQMADRYNSTEQKRSIYRFLLPIARLLAAVMVFIMLISIISAYLIGWGYAISSMLIFGLSGGLLTITARILELICYYKTFRDYEPEYSVLYLLLCLFGLDWISIFLCRNNVPVGIAGHCHPRQPRYNVN